LNSFCAEVFSKGRIMTTSPAAWRRSGTSCGGAAADARGGTAAKKSERNARSVAANRLNIEITFAKKPKRPAAL
jgi:hypothetical protein